MEAVVHPDAASTPAADTVRKGQLGLRLVGWALVLHAAGFLLTQLIWRFVHDLSPLAGGISFATPVLELLAALGVTWYARGRQWASPAQAAAARLAVTMYWVMFGLSLVGLAAGEVGAALQLWPLDQGESNWWLIANRILWSANLLAVVAGNLCLLAGFDIHPGWRWAAVGVLIVRVAFQILSMWFGLRPELGRWADLALTTAWLVGYFAIWAIAFFLQARRSPAPAEAGPAWAPVVQQGLVHYRRALLGRILVLLVGLLSLVLAITSRSAGAATVIGLLVMLAGLGMAGWSMLGIAMLQVLPKAGGLRAPARTALVLGALGLLADCAAGKAVVDALNNQYLSFGHHTGSEVDAVLGAAGQLLGLAAFVALLVFLGRLARRAGQAALAGGAGRLLGWVVGLAIGMVLLRLLIWFGRPPPVLLVIVALGLLIMAIVIVVRYIRLLVGLEKGLTDLASAESFE